MEWLTQVDWWNLFLNIASSSTVILVIITAWYKIRLEGSIKHEYAKKLAEVTSDLKIGQEVALTEIRKSTVEHQVTYAKLQEKRFDRIEDLYLSLVQMDTLLGGENEAKCREDFEDFEEKFTTAIKELSTNAIKTYPYVNSTIEITLKEMCENGHKYHAQLLTILGYSDYEGNSPIDLTNEEFDLIVSSLEKSIKAIGRELKLITGVETNSTSDEN